MTEKLKHYEDGFTSTTEKDGGREQEAVVNTEPAETHSPEILAKDVKEIVEEADRKQDEHLLENYYTKGQTDAKITSTCYTKTQVDNLVNAKQDVIDDESVESGSVSSMLGLDSEGNLVKGTVPEGSVVDSELDTDSTNPVENKAIAQAFDDLETGVKVVAKSQVAEGLSTNVGTLDKTPFAYMTSGGQTDVETGYQRNLKLVGSTIVNNQLVRNLATKTSSGITITGNDNNHTISFVGTTTETLNTSICTSIAMIQGHKYLILTPNKSNDVKISLAYGSNDLGNSVFTASSSATTVINAYANAGVSLDTTFELYIIDLTQMFGSNDVVNAIIGNDTSKQVANLMLFLGGWLPTTYDTGTLIPSKSAYLKSVMYNQWDEQWELGYIDMSTGQNASSSSNIRSKNYIRVEPNTVYYIKAPSTPSYLNVCYYDGNKNLIKATYPSTNNTTTTPINACYMRFYCESGYGSTYNNDICIFIYWDGSKITYEPYEEKIEPLPNIEINGILKVDGDGNVYADGDELYPDGTGKRRYGAYTFTGSEVWSNYGNYGKMVDVLTGQEATSISSSTQTTNVLNDAGLVPTSRDNVGNIEDYNGIALNGKTVLVSASAISSLTGKTIIYKLATETDITSTPFNENIFADDFGTLQFLDGNSAEIVGLQGAEIFYKANVSGFAESLYVRTNGDSADVVVQSELSAEDTKVDDLYAIMQANVGGALRHQLADKANIDFANTDWVDLGTLTPSYNTTWNCWQFVLIDNIKPATSNSTEANILCSILKTVVASGYTSSHQNYTISLNTSGQIFVDNGSSTNPPKGILLAYEKASE